MEWMKINSEERFIKIVHEGVKPVIVYKTSSRDRSKCNNVQKAVQKQCFLEEIETLLEKNAIQAVSRAQEGQGFYSNFFVDAKRDGGYRPFLNIKPLSCITPESSFQNGISQVNNTGFEFRILGSINRSEKMYIYICRYIQGTRNTSDFA